MQPYLADRAAVDTKLDIARTAAEAITTLWTYTPDNMESLADRSARFLGGDFEAQYRKYVDAIAPTNKQAQVTNNTQVVGAAVESLDGAGRDCHRLHELHGDEPTDQEHSFAAVSVLPAHVAACGRRPGS